MAGQGLQLHFAGGSGEQGRSCYALCGDFGTLLLDCGVARLFSAKGAGDYPLLRLAELRQPFAVLLSHAHEDHCAALPWLAQQGVPFTVFCHPLTARLVPESCRAWCAAVRAAGWPAPYSEASIAGLVFAAPPSTIGPFRLTTGSAGHLPGSLWYLLEGLGLRLLFTGDWCTDNPLLAPPAFPEQVDVVLTDAAHADAAHADAPHGLAEASAKLAALVDAAVVSGGRVLCAVPRYGRGQEMLLSHLARASSEVPLWVERKLVEGLSLFEAAREQLSSAGEQLLASFRSEAVRLFEEPREVAARPGLIWATDAMLSRGCSALLAQELLDEPSSRVVLSGHQASGTPGAALLAASHPQVVWLPWKVHPDSEDVLGLLRRQRPEAMHFVVHLEAARAAPLVERLRAAGLDARLCRTGDTLELRR